MNEPRCRVLVVDDERLIRWSLAEILGASGCDVVEASDGRTALTAAAQTRDPFDVVVLDFRLPDSQDLKLLSRLRDLMPQAQVILMTAFGTPEVVEGALHLGAYRVVSKPFDNADLAALVSEAHQARVH